MSNDENGWREWSNYVLKELERQNDNLEKLTEYVNHRNEIMDEKIIDTDKRLEKLELTLSATRWVAGIVIGILIKYAIDWIMTMR